MQLEPYIAQFSLPEIIAIEEQDSQFLSLQNARSQIVAQYGDTPTDRNLFLLLVLQCALVWFQIAWSWPKRREEFSQKIIADRSQLQQLDDNIDRRYSFLTTSTYNKRLYNIKRKRLEKFLNADSPQVHIQSLESYANSMDKLRTDIAQHMQQNKTNKTVSFSVKMYGYAVRITSNTFIPYPANIPIPVDSRLTAIYKKNEGKNTSTDSGILDYYQSLADKYIIPPLHLDSLLWIDYREKYC